MDSSGALYMQDDAVWYQLQTSPDLILSKFYPVEKAPDFVKPLNLEVYALDSKGGKHSLIGTSNEIRLMAPNSTRHYYEERTYEVPKGTQELIIALNFPWELRDTSGNPMARPPWGLTNYPVVVNETPHRRHSPRFSTRRRLTRTSPPVPGTVMAVAAAVAQAVGEMTPMMRSYCPAMRTRTPGWTGPRCRSPRRNPA